MEPAKFRLQSKVLFVTYPQCPVPKDTMMAHLNSKLDVEWALVAQEEHKDGNAHLHALVKLNSKLTTRNPRLLDYEGYHCNLQAAKSINASVKYLTKSDPEPLSFKIDLKNLVNSVDKKKRILSDALVECKTNAELASFIKDNALAMQAAQVHKSWATIRALESEAYEADDVRGIWYYGPPGTGKSRAARELGEFYLKQQNKWWDGYAGQPVVILDDLDRNGVCLFHHLKIWADRYACTGEIKGGTVNLQHKTFVVTSNYSIDDLFEDEQVREAIRRRFKVTHFNGNIFQVMT